MDRQKYEERVKALTEGLAIFNHHDMTRLREEDITALKAAVEWAGDEDFYSDHADNPAKRAAKVLLKHYNSAHSIEKEAQVHATSETVRGPTTSSSGAGA